MSDELKGLTRLREDVLAGTLNRRDVLKRGAVLGLSAPIIASLLAACGDDDEEGDDANSGEATSTTGTGDADRITKMTYDNAEDYLIRMQEGLNWFDKSDGRHVAMKQFLDDKTFKPGLGAFDKSKVKAD